MPLPESDGLGRVLDRCISLAITSPHDVFRATDMEFATRQGLASGKGTRRAGGDWNPKEGFARLTGAFGAGRAPGNHINIGKMLENY
jgi:hypothetical protein